MYKLNSFVGIAGTRILFVRINGSTGFSTTIELLGLMYLISLFMFIFCIILFVFFI